ncbi:Hypothetical predicted protein [Lecanosticta acicola]|uniref:Uncharacterized protein n=1 Tax=Lecanosticta acicola TaxID=111012 RepID=A0AAI8Z018_9PEZI|nr:Hypothetical predicted protein [Lecanosticta acicola]
MSSTDSLDDSLQPFRLFDLPQELRDRIYDHMVLDFELPRIERGQPDAPPVRRVFSNARILAVTLSSRQLSREYRDRIPPPSHLTAKYVSFEPGRDPWKRPSRPETITHLQVEFYVFCKPCIQHDGFGSSPYCVLQNRESSGGLARFMSILQTGFPKLRVFDVRLALLAWCVQATTWSEMKRSHPRLLGQVQYLTTDAHKVTGIQLLKYSGIEDFDTILSGDSWRYTMSTWKRGEGWKAAPGRE